MTLKIGDNAPVFVGINQDGKKIALKDFKGKKVILYFYPKDNTTGCTNQACNLRDNYKILTKEGYEIIGVSKDSEKSHKQFATKHTLPFQLVADTNLVIQEQYGVWGEKMLYGKKYMGTIRTTFVIDEKGKIEEIISKVNTKEHSEQIFKIKN